MFYHLSFLIIKVIYIYCRKLGKLQKSIKKKMKSFVISYSLLNIAARVILWV